MKRLLCGMLVCCVLTAGMFICPAFAASAFPDVDENADYAEAVDYVSDVGIMVGDENGNFNPERTVTRAEMSVILCNMLGETENLTADGSVFTDVPANHWANSYVVKAAELGLVSGYGDGRFGPLDAVTYEQAVTMVVCALGGRLEGQEAGGYPDGFLSAAYNAELLVGLSLEKGMMMSRGDTAMLVYNGRIS